MGASSRQALASTVSSLTAGKKLDATTGEQLLAAARAIGGSSQLRGLLADFGLSTRDKESVVQSVFGGYTVPARAVIVTAAKQRWSSESELVAGIEEVGLRVIAGAAPATVSVERELFAFGRAVTSSNELELAVGSKLGDSAAKVTLVDGLLKNASEPTRVIVRHLVQFLSGRRFGEALSASAAVVADVRGLDVATVRSAVALSAAQLARLEKALSARYGRALSINVIVDPSLIGGLRISIGDDVIDGSVVTRLSDLRLQLAG